MTCTNCGVNNQDGIQFCASCGQPIGQQGALDPDAADAQQNKAVAILAYFIFFIPLLAAKESRFARYHANQGLILLLFSVGTGIINSILSGLLFTSLLTGGFGLWGILSLIFTLAYIALTVVGILGIVNAAQGKMKPMPVIGSLFTIIK